MEIIKTINTQIIFEADTECGKFRDSIYIPEGQEKDDKAIDAEIATRINNHIDAIKNPPIIPEISIEEQLILDEKYLQYLAIQIDEFERIQDEKTIEVGQKRITVEAIIQERELELQEEIIEERI